jgi:hypothetical protein
MKKTSCCCIAIPLLGLGLALGAAGYLLFARWTVEKSSGEPSAIW